jgi:hypothetical protein
MVRLMLKKCATEATKLTTVNNMNFLTLIVICIWVFISGFVYGRYAGIKIGVERSGINITCHKAFGVTNVPSK